MRFFREFFDAFKELLAQFIDDVLSLMLAIVSSLIPAWWFAQTHLPFPWWPVWSFREWLVVLVCVFFVFRLWRTLRKAAV